MGRAEIVKDLLKAIVEEAYLEEVLSSLVWYIKDSYKPQSCGVILEENGLKVKISRGLSYTYIKRLHSEGRHPLVERMRKEMSLMVVNEEHPLYPTGFEHPYKLMVMVPVFKRSDFAGILFMDFSESVDLSDDDLSFFETLGYLASVALSYYELEDRVEELNDRDTLTGVYNFKRFHELLFNEVKRADETGHPFVLALFAVTGLGSVNEKYGHVAGDELLKFVARILQEKVRRFDVVARYSAAKFVVILPETDKSWAKGLAEEIIKEFENSEWGRKDVEVYLDVGIVAYPEDANNEKILLNRLEECVLEAKRQRGHKIVLWPV